MEENRRINMIAGGNLRGIPGYVGEGMSLLHRDNTVKLRGLNEHASHKKQYEKIMGGSHERTVIG